MKKLKKSDVLFTIECLPEYTPIWGNVTASGDAAVDREAEELVVRELTAGNNWAWCVICVTAHYAGESASEMLGACSYKSEAHFKRRGGYYSDMCDAAFRQLQAKLTA